MADSGVEDLDPNLVGLGGRDLDLLDAELLARLPRDGGLALDNLVMADGDVSWGSFFSLPLHRTRGRAAAVSECEGRDPPCPRCQPLLFSW